MIKKSALYIVSMEVCNDDDVKELKAIFQEDDQSDEKVTRVKAIWDKSNIRDRVEDVKKTFYRESQSSLSLLENQNMDISLLEYISKILLNRSR